MSVEDRIAAIISKFPAAGAKVGNLNLNIYITKRTLSRFQLCGKIDDDAIRACLAAGEDFDTNIFVADTLSMESKALPQIPDGTNT